VPRSDKNNITSTTGDIAGPQIKKLQKTEIGEKKCGWEISSAAGERWRRQHKKELDGDKCYAMQIYKVLRKQTVTRRQKWSVTKALLGVKRNKSSKA